MRTRLGPRWIILSMALTLLSCERPDGPREAPYPVFDPVQPFPELVAGSGGESSGSESFEDALNEAQRDERLDEQAFTESGSYQNIPLASLFVAEVPLLFDEWQYVTDAQSTLLVHRKPGQMPDAVVYVEAFSQAVEDFPSYEVARFQFTVDPALAPNSVYPPLGALIVTGGEEGGGAPALDVAMALQLAATRTMGRGLGYQSSGGSFTGWKWVGRTPADLDVRLGRSAGRWGAQKLPVGAIVDQILSRYGAQYPELRQLGETFAQFGGTSAARTPGPAWMVIGSIAQRRNPSMGTHIAMLCTQRPVCPVSKELAHLLESMRMLRDAGQLAAPASEDYIAFANEAGVELLASAQVLSAQDILHLLEQSRRR